jgi:TonB-dependent SusC/RagA subfamily outer membrane receptor
MKHFLVLYPLLAVIVSCGTAKEAAVFDRGEMNVGYMNESRENNALTVSEVRVTGAEEQIFKDIFEYLRNKVPGVEVGNTSGAGDRPHVQIRGNRSITGNEGEPLFIVDGVEYPQIENIRPEEVYSVQVLKDSGASSYGSRGANGVISITTKVAHEAEERERAARKAERAARRGK